MRIKAAAFAAVIAAAAGTAIAAPAHAAPSTATAVTHVINRPDGGNGGTWAYDDLTRTLTVTVAASQAGVPEGDTAYTATVTDKGTFTAIEGSLTPNQATAGLKVAHAVKGTITGSITYTVTAPSADVIASLAVAAENDDYAAPIAADTTASWPERVFASTVGVTVTEGSTWSWTYATGCEKWTDSSANGDGNQAADGNIAGKVCAVPHLTGGHVISVSNNDVVLGWKFGPGVHYVLARTFGYGFTVNGSPHLGFTGADKGYWSGLAAGHTYDIELIPAGANRQPLPHAVAGWITVVTTR